MGRRDFITLFVEHAHELSPLWNRQSEQLLCCKAEAVLLVHWGPVIKPVEIWDALQIGLVLDQLLGAAVQAADMRIDALDDLAIKSSP
jgi:hypothetical protein